MIQSLLGGSIDMAWLGASAYAKTWLTDPEGVEPVLVKVNVEGGYGDASAGFAREDSGITSLDDMKGKVVCFGDPNSTSGYQIPSIEMPATVKSTMNSGDYFGEVKFTGGHEQTIVLVNNGDIKAGATWADGLGNSEEGYKSCTLPSVIETSNIAAAASLVGAPFGHCIVAAVHAGSGALAADDRSLLEIHGRHARGSRDRHCAGAGLHSGRGTGADPLMHQPATMTNGTFV